MFTGVIRALTGGLISLRRALRRPRPGDEDSSEHAFQNNSLAGCPGLFPLSFTVRNEGPRLWSATLFAQSMKEASEVFLRYAGPWICVYDVSHYERDSSGTPSSLVELACDLGLAVTAPDRDVIVMPASKAAVFLEDLYHYNMSMYDIDRCNDADETLAHVLAAMDVRWDQGELVLRVIEGAHFYLNSHDDCYLHIESRSWEHLRDHLRCLLGHYASSRLAVPVALPPAGLVDDYLARYDSMSIVDAQAEVIGGVLRAPCAAEPFHFDGVRPAAVAMVCLDAAAGEWSFEYIR